MPVKATLADIRKYLVFTDGMRPLTIERLDLKTGKDIVPVQVRMCNAKLKLHKELDPTDLWTYDGLYPGKIFVVRNDQTIAVEWINEIKGKLPFSVVASGYEPLDQDFVHPENEPGAFDGDKGQENGRAACKPDKDAMELTAWTVVHQIG